MRVVVDVIDVVEIGLRLRRRVGLDCDFAV